MMIASYLSSSASFLTSMRRSSRSVQQTQPFCISTSFSWVSESFTPFLMRLASTFISAISLTMRATLSHLRFSSMCLRSVVLPLPRNPESIVTGMSFFIYIFGVILRVILYCSDSHRYYACIAFSEILVHF